MNPGNANLPTGGLQHARRGGENGASSSPMKIHLVMLGKTRRPEIRALMEDYLARIATIRRCATDRIARRFPRVGCASWRSIQPRPWFCLMTPEKRKLRRSLRNGWEKLATAERGRLRFYVEGAEGFPEALRRRAAQKLSLSPLTFSHELARTMLAEQLYRAFAILAGHPYPK